jgi:exosortase/archaeosortase family protein
VALRLSGKASNVAIGLDVTSTFGRRELLLWLACILFASQILVPPGGTSGEAVGFMQALLSRSIFFYLAWYVVITLLLASDRHQPTSRFEVASMLSLAALNLLPVLNSSWLSTTAIAVFLLLRPRNDAAVRAAATVLLALCFNGYWGPKLFDLFAYYLLRADAALVGAALYLTQPGMSWDGTVIGRPGAHSVLIFSPCSSFHNISLGLLCWVSVTKMYRTSWIRRDFAVALGVCATVILFNAVRLYLMALGSEQYAYWHVGPGEQVVAWGTTMAVLLISLWGATRSGKSG